MISSKQRHLKLIITKQKTVGSKMWEGLIQTKQCFSGTLKEGEHVIGVGADMLKCHHVEMGEIVRIFL